MYAWIVYYLKIPHIPTINMQVNCQTKSLDGLAISFSFSGNDNNGKPRNAFNHFLHVFLHA